MRSNGTGRCGDTWGRPMFSSGRQSADMMMMIDYSLKLFSTTTRAKPPVEASAIIQIVPG